MRSVCYRNFGSACPRRLAIAVPRADARRNRERVLASAAEVFARSGHDAQMEQVAAHAGLGVGTLYRHFPSKRALLTAIVKERFENTAAAARSAEALDDPGEAFETVLRTYLEAADGDTGFQLAMLGSTDLDREEIDPPKDAFAEVVARVIARAVAAGAVRSDLTYDDFPVLTCAVMSIMYFRPGERPDWRRHLDLVLDGLRPTPRDSRPHAGPATATGGTARRT